MEILGMTAQHKNIENLADELPFASLSDWLVAPVRMALLIACGNSICGNSAIAAVAPVIDADSNDVAASIAFTAVLGVLVGSVVSLQSVWNFADLANALMAVPNLISLIALAPVLVAETKTHLWELKD